MGGRHTGTSFKEGDVIHRQHSVRAKELLGLPPVKYVIEYVSPENEANFASYHSVKTKVYLKHCERKALLDRLI
jgi:hypothetical protein